MENKKDIGSAFSEKVKSLEKTPSDKVWLGISQELQKNKKKRRIAFFLFWGKTFGLLFVASLITFYIYNQNDGFLMTSPDNSIEKNKLHTIEQNASKSSDNKTMANQNSKTNQSENILVDNENSTEINNNLNNKNSVRTKKSVINKSNAKSEVDFKNLNNYSNSNTKRKWNLKNKNDKNNYFGKNKNEKSNSISFSTKKKGKQFKKGKSKEKLISDEMIVLKYTSTKIDTTSFDESDLRGEKISETVAKMKAKKKDSIASKKEKSITITMYPKDSIKKDSAKIFRKFHFDAFVSPSYYGFFGNKSTIDNRLDSQSKQSEIKLSYGFGLSFDLNKKIAVRIGFQKMNLSYVTKNAPIISQNYSNIDYNPTISNQTIVDATNGIGNMDITQKIVYFEVPFEVKYKFLDKKITADAITGFSFLYLNGNSVSIETDTGYIQDLGKTSGILTTSFSVNFGVGFGYEIFKNTKIIVEPMFNYQIKSFENKNNKPFTIGLHTGFRYTFNN